MYKKKRRKRRKRSKSRAKWKFENVIIFWFVVRWLCPMNFNSLYKRSNFKTFSRFVAFFDCAQRKSYVRSWLEPKIDEIERHKRIRSIWKANRKLNYDESKWNTLSSSSSSFSVSIVHCCTWQNLFQRVFRPDLRSTSGLWTLKNKQQRKKKRRKEGKKVPKSQNVVVTWGSDERTWCFTHGSLSKNRDAENTLFERPLERLQPILGSFDLLNPMGPTISSRCLFRSVEREQTLFHRSSF